MTIASRAVKEAKDVADLAVAAAKNELIEQLTPTIRAIIDGQIRAGVLGNDVAALRSEGVNRMRQAQDYDGISDFEEGLEMKSKKKEKFESVTSLFPDVAEVSDMQTEADEDDIGEAMDDTDDVTAEAADDMDEELEISESELEEMYAEALQLEVDVTKGFKDMAKPHDFGAGAKGQYQSDPANLADYKTGEHQWDDEEPPAKKDYSVKEAANIRKMVKRGMAENRVLSSQNARLTEMVKSLHGKLSEMNLLNSKILHVNKFMAANRLTTEQKKTVIESIDRGTTVKEVKSIFSIIQSSFRAAGATVNESARERPRANSQRARTTGAVNPQVLRESTDRLEDGSSSRWQQLAGLKKIVG